TRDQSWQIDVGHVLRQVDDAALVELLRVSDGLFKTPPGSARDHQRDVLPNSGRLEGAQGVDVILPGLDGADHEEITVRDTEPGSLDLAQRLRTEEALVHGVAHNNNTLGINPE